MREILSLVSGPAKEPVTLEEVIAQLRLLDVENLHAALITAARQHIDGRDGWLGRALITQTWDLCLSRFPAKFHRHDWPPVALGKAHWEKHHPERPRDAILLPLPPLQSIAWIKYVDSSGITQTLSSADYVVYDKAEPAFIIPTYGNSWPSARWQPDAVQVRFTAGYGDNPEDVPRPIRQALLMLIAHWYENREAVEVSASRAIALEVPRAVDALLYPYRVYH